MNKTKVIGGLLLLVSLVAVVGTAAHLLRQKQRQMLCFGYLQHWGTALHLYLQQQEQRGRTPAGSAEEWYVILRGYLYSLEVAHCPAVEAPAQQYSYKLNREALIAPGSRTLSLANRPPTVFLFDGKCDELAVTAAQPPYAEVANRHLGGANLLLLSGAVVYVAAMRNGIASGDIGWTGTGDQKWK